MRNSKSFRRGFSWGQLLFIICGMGLVLGFVAGAKFFPKQWLAGLVSSEIASKVLALHIPGSGGEAKDFLSLGDEAEGLKLILAQSSGALGGDAPVTAEPEFPEQFQQDNGNLNERPIIPQDTPKPEEEQGKNPLADPSQPLVAFYCTHNAETYNASEGVDKVAGKNGGVFQVARVMQGSLSELGISSVLCDTIHDYPDWKKSYANSLNSIKQLQEEYPSLKVFVDVHRDAKPEGGTTILQTGDGSVAKLMLVVGSNKRLEHPNWNENLSFAQRIGNALEDECPGIMRGVRVQDGRYNQHVSTYSILLEMGSTENSLEEARASGLIVARVLADIIKSEEALSGGQQVLADEKEQIYLGSQ